REGGVGAGRHLDRAAPDRAARGRGGPDAKRILRDQCGGEEEEGVHGGVVSRPRARQPFHFCLRPTGKRVSSCWQSTGAGASSRRLRKSEVGGRTTGNG